MVFPLTTTTRHMQLDFPRHWTTDPVRYRGSQIHTDPQRVLHVNYEKALLSLQAFVARWIKLTLSMYARNAIIKMKVIPRFLFFFINIPILLTRAFFAKLKTLLMQLVWAGRQPIVRCETLTLPYEKGGMCAPDLDAYYRTAVSSHT